MPVPKLIIHGGAGNITPQNLRPEQWEKYRCELHRIYVAVSERMKSPDAAGGGGGGISALDAATEAVRMMEDSDLFNCGKGAVCLWSLFFRKVSDP